MKVQWERFGGRILLGDYTVREALILRLIMFQCVGFRIFTGFPCVYAYTRIFDESYTRVLLGRISAFIAHSETTTAYLVCLQLYTIIIIRSMSMSNKIYFVEKKQCFEKWSVWNLIIQNIINVLEHECNLRFSSYPKLKPWCLHYKEVMDFLQVIKIT